MRARLVGGMPDRPRRLAHRPDRRAASRSTPRPATPTTSTSARPPSASQRRPERRRPGRGRRHAPRHPRLRRRRQPRGRHPRRHGRQARHDRAPGPLRPGPRRARQHLHLRRASPRSRPAPGRQARRQAGAPSPSRSPPRARRRAEGRRRRAARQRLFAHPARPKARKAGGDDAARPRRRRRRPGPRRATSRTSSTSSPTRSPGSSSSPARASSPAPILGRIGKTSSTHAPHVLFEIRPAGRGAPRIDPKPILDGWKLLESTAIYRAKHKNPFHGKDADGADDRPDPAHEQGRARQQRVLANPRIDIQGDGRLRHPQRHGRPPRARDARVPRRQRPQADGLEPLPPGLDHRLGQPLAPLDRHRGRHLRRQRHADHRPPGRRARSPTSRSAAC